MKHCLEQALERVEWMLRLEQSPFSLNTHYLADYRSKFIAHYKGAREMYQQDNLMRAIENHKANSSSPVPPTQATGNRNSLVVQQPTGIAKVLAGLSEIGIVGIKAEDLPKLLPPDPMEPALGIMADVRAYFQG
jgi:hypothetical protein